MLSVYQYLKNKFFAPLQYAAPAKRYVVKSGQKVWECNLATGDIVEADVKAVPGVDKRGNQCITREVIMKPNCLYDFALNGENAVRKFETRLKEYFEKNGQAN